MLLEILTLRTAYLAVGTIAVLGAGVKLIVGSIYKRDIRNARSMEHTKKNWLQKMKGDFETTFGDGLIRDTDLFVENEMSGRSVLGISVKALDEFINQLPLGILTVTVAFDFVFVGKRVEAGNIILYTLFGVTVALAIHTFNMMVNNDGKAGRLKVILTQYFSNERMPYIWKNQYENKEVTDEANLRQDIKYPVALNKNESTSLLAVAKEAAAKKEDFKSAIDGRKKYKAEKHKIKLLRKEQKKEERVNRRNTKEMLKQNAIKREYEEKIKKLQEKYQMESRREAGSDNLQPAFAGVTKTQEEIDVLSQGSRSERSMEGLNRTLKDAFPETKKSADEEKLIEEVLKEYLFR